MERSLKHSTTTSNLENASVKRNWTHIVPTGRANGVDWPYFQAPIHCLETIPKTTLRRSKCHCLLPTGQTILSRSRRTPSTRRMEGLTCSRRRVDFSPFTRISAGCLMEIEWELLDCVKLSNSIGIGSAE